MPSSQKDARAARTGAALREALLRLLSREAFDKITVRDVCAEAGVHYATFFRHQPTKEALLNHIAAEQISTLVDLTLPIQEAIGHTIAIGALFDYIEERRSLWSTLLNGGAGAVMREEWLRRARIVSDTYEGAVSWLPQELGTICSVSLIIETVTWWLRQPQGEYSSGEVAGILSRLISTTMEF